MKKIFLIIFALGISWAGFAQTTLIHAGRLIDVKNMKVLTQQTIKVEGATIVSVAPGFQAPKVGEKLIDLSRSTVMHVH